MAHIAELSALEGAALNDAKRALADEATRLLHGDGCLAEIHRAVAAQFGGGGGGSLEGLPRVEVPPERVCRRPGIVSRRNPPANFPSPTFQNLGKSARNAFFAWFHIL